MITLHNFGPKFGLPDPSLFCMKTMVLLKMAGQPYRTADCDPRKAPKGKAPFLIDGGVSIPDSTFIRWHLEEKYGVDFDDGLSPAERGVAWAFEKLCEDNLYWAVLHERWMVQENFYAGPRAFFDSIPGAMQPFVVNAVRGQVKRDLKGHGFGRHSREEIMKIAKTGIDAIGNHLGEKQFLMGDQPCGADATVFATVGSLLSETFDTELIKLTKAHDNLVAYRDRCMAKWFPDFDPSN